MLGRIRRQLFGIPLDETTVARRGFGVSDPRRRRRIEQIGAAFVHGYHAALITPRGGETLRVALDRVPNERRGFAYEGAAMGLALLDFVSPWAGGRLTAFIEGIGASHIYMAHVGAGWAMARVPWGLSRGFTRLDPLLRWLALDGYGFHEGYFRWPAMVGRQRVPRRFSGYRARAFDQGLGRSLWFVKGADPDGVAGAIDGFAASRHADLWAGVGLAAAYAGGNDGPALEILRTRAAAHRPALAQGAAFAAKTRQRAGNPAVHTELACRVFCGIDADAAAAVTDAALPADDPETGYEAWRKSIQDHFGESG